jgi:hypothetical protein
MCKMYLIEEWTDVATYFQQFGKPKFCRITVQFCKLELDL